MVVHTLRDQPSIFSQQKVTIRKGVISHKTVWKDTNGNELEQVSKSPPRFVVKRKPMPVRFVAPTPHETSESDMLDLILILSMALLMTSVFFLGYFVGSRQRSLISNMTQPIEEINSKSSSVRV